MKNLIKLTESICNTYDLVYQGERVYAPNGDVTYCNYAANSVALGMGCTDLIGLMANEIYAKLSLSDGWQRIEMKDAQFTANQGSLVFAVQANAAGHGHICVVRPGLERKSGKWGTVPVVMNIGKECSISKGVNWAFGQLPDFYVWKKSL